VILLHGPGGFLEWWRWGWGVAWPNFLTIERMNTWNSQGVKAISHGDAITDLSVQKKRLLDQAKGKVLLFQLMGRPIDFWGGQGDLQRNTTPSPRCDFRHL